MKLLTVNVILLFCCPVAGLAQLHIDLTADRTGGCSPLVVRYTAIVSGADGGVSYSWDLGNGNRATGAAPQAVYTAVGSYVVTLTVSDGNQTTTGSVATTVYPPPEVRFGPSAGVVCGGPVGYTANAGSTGSGADVSGAPGDTIVSWLWDFGDGTTSTEGPATTHTYAKTGMAGASLTVTDNHGCTASLAQPAIVQVLPALHASFSADRTVVCTTADPVSFTNSSTGPGTLTYLWDFGDGTSSTVANPRHVYAAKGNYPVRLTVNSSAGCTALYIQPQPVNAANFSTDFGWPAGNICAGTPIPFTDNSYPDATSRTWQINGVTEAIYDPFVYTLAAGTYTVMLNNVFGACRQTLSKAIVINAGPPSASFAVSTQQNCTGFGATFTDGSNGGYSRAWDLNYSFSQLPSSFIAGGASVTKSDYQYNTPYTVALRLTNAAGCSTMITRSVEIDRAIPVVDAAGGSAMSCNQSITKSYTYSYPGVLQSFYWDFGDGVTSTAGSATHNWTQPGSYSVVFHYVDANGCTGQVNGGNIVIGTTPVLDFTAAPTTVCVGSTVNFTSPSLVAAGPVSANWNFGDGGVSNLPYHIYTNPGTYSVALNAVTQGGCTASVTKPQYITVIAPPGVYNGHTNTCDGNRDVVSFQYSATTASSGAPPGAANLAWDFGDGQRVAGSGAAGQQHTCGAAGTYYINVTASNGVCTVQNSDVVRVLPKQKPVLTAGSGAVCADGSLEVRVAVTRNPWEIGSGYYDDYTPQFYYSDGKAFTGVVTFTQPEQPYYNGAFGWTLSGFQAGESGLYVVLTSFGFHCTDVSDAVALTVRGTATPALKVVSDGHCSGEPVELQDVSTVDAGNTIVSGAWDLGDGHTQPLVVGSAVSHIYSDPGVYHPRLTIQDAAGCTASSSGTGQATVTVNGPKAAFTVSATQLLLGTTLYVYNTTNTYGTASPGYTWDFGDGSGSNSFNDTHQYLAPGTYVVTLTASDVGTRCGNRVRDTIVVQRYFGGFTTSTSYVSGGCPPVLVSFTNASIGYSSIGWDFGDGMTAGNVPNPSHVYRTPGRYTVKLSLYGPSGLLGVDSDIVVVDQPVGRLTAPAMGVCKGVAAELHGAGIGSAGQAGPGAGTGPGVSSAGAVSGFLFDFGDGVVVSGADTVASHVYAQPGNYMARLVVTDTAGCSAAAGNVLQITVWPNPLIRVLPVSPVACLGGSVELRASGGASYSWNPAVGLDSPAGADRLASPVMNTVYIVVAVDTNGCTGSDSVLVRVQQPERVSVSPDSLTICAGMAAKFAVKGADNYQWIGDTTGLTFADAGGSAGLNGAGGGSGLNGAGAGAGLNGVAGGVVLAQPDGSRVYTIVGSDTNNCFHDTAAVSVTVLPEQAHLANAFTPNGDGHNDRFGVTGIGEVHYLAVYDRWGERIFEKVHFYAGDRGSTWDGTEHGLPAPAGVYVYYVEMTCPTGGIFQQKGTVILVR